jgi:hypothetical protein
VVPGTRPLRSHGGTFAAVGAAARDERPLLPRTGRSARAEIRPVGRDPGCPAAVDVQQAGTSLPDQHPALRGWPSWRAETSPRLAGEGLQPSIVGTSIVSNIKRQME